MSVRYRYRVSVALPEVGRTRRAPVVHVAKVADRTAVEGIVVGHRPEDSAGRLPVVFVIAEALQALT